MAPRLARTLLTDGPRRGPAPRGCIFVSRLPPTRNTSIMIEHRGARLPHRRRAAALLAGLLGACASASAFNYVADAKGTWWGIQDAAPPRVDTGSIRATQVGPGQTPAFSTTLNGFAGIRVGV